MAGARPDSGGFLGEDFLLTTAVARRLFHEVAAGAPIVDVHTHLPPADIAGDRHWRDLAGLWLDDDHYKWRAMRAAGFDEALITGDAEPRERFDAWAATVPRLVGNPLYVWTHLELRRVFVIDLILSPATAEEIWHRSAEQLAELSAQSLLKHFSVELVATTDDPTDSLDHHQAHRAASASPRMVPTFRPDRAHALLGDPTAWNAWVDRLSHRTGTHIDDLVSLLDALSLVYDEMEALGARASDHGLSRVPDRPRDPERADELVAAARSGRPLNEADRELVALEVLDHVAGLAVSRGHVVQLHLGPIRNVSPRLMEHHGPDAGADVMGDRPQVAGLARFLGDLESRGRLPRTVLYNLNPADNAAFAALAGAFARSGIAGLVQWGPPWWFNDHEAGMRRHLDQLAEIGQLAGFFGMLTDSRSVLSMTRHELFRRVLCAKLGDDVAAGRIPDDWSLLSGLVADLSLANCRRYFGF